MQLEPEHELRLPGYSLNFVQPHRLYCVLTIILGGETGGKMKINARKWIHCWSISLPVFLVQPLPCDAVSWPHLHFLP